MKARSWASPWGWGRQTRAVADGGDGAAANRPDRRVDRVDVVVDDRVSAQGNVVAPNRAAEPAFDRLALGRIGRLVPAPLADRRHRPEPAETAVPNASHDLAVDRIGGHLVIDEEAKVLLRGEFSGGPDGQAARRVDGDRLGEVDVAAGGDGGRGLLGIEAGDVQHAQRLDAAVEDLLIARQAREAARLVHAEGLAAGVDEIGKIVGDGDRTRSRRGRETALRARSRGLRSRPSPT